MSTLRNHLQIGSDEDVRENLAKCAHDMRKIASSIPVRPVDDYVGIAGQRVLRYVAGEVDGAKSALRNDINHFAWRLRNIFEGFLIFRYIVSSSDNAKSFFAQKIGDEVTILESVLSLETGSNGDVSAIKERIEKGKQVLANYGFNKASPWRIDILAKNVGKKDEYDAFYKLFSKYVHPSSWVMVSEVDEYTNELYWEIFLMNAQLYSLDCCGEGEALLKSRGVSINKDR